MSRKQWIGTRNEDNRFLAAECKRKGQVIHCSAVHQVDAPEELTGTLSLAVSSSKASILVEEFPKLKEDLLKLQIENKLDQRALFDVGEAVSISYHKLEERHQKQLLAIIAQPSTLTLKAIEEATSGGNIEVKTCVPTIAAVAALMKQINPDPYIVLFIGRLSAFVIGVRDGIPLFLQSIPLVGPAEVETGVASHAIGFARQTLHREFNIASCKLVCLGEGRNNFSFAELEEENWIPDWSHCLVAKGDEIALYPGLFGALFTETNFSYLPAEYGRAGRLKKTAALITIFLICGTVFLGVLTYQNTKNNILLKSRIAQEKTALAREVKEIRRILPAPDQAARIESYLNIASQVAGEEETAAMLLAIAQLLPANVHVHTLTIAREKKTSTDGSETTALIPPPGSEPMDEEQPSQDIPAAELLLKQPLSISMVCNSAGEYSRVKSRFDMTVARLATRFTLKDVEWEYSEDQAEGTFRCKLMVTNKIL